MFADPFQSRGFRLVLADGTSLIDATPDSAGMGIGWHASASFGAMQFAEAWTGDLRSQTFRQLQRSMAEFLVRKAGWSRGHVVFGGSARDLSLSPEWDADPSPVSTLDLTFPQPADLQDIALKLAGGRFKALRLTFKPWLSVGGGQGAGEGDDAAAAWLGRLQQVVAEAAVALVFDERGLGLHAGPDFFWHRQLGSLGHSCRPEEICCEAFAGTQARLVSRPELADGQVEVTWAGDLHPANFAMDYIAAHLLDQLQQRNQELAEFQSSLIGEISRHPSAEWVRVGNRGLLFWLAFSDEARSQQFLALARQQGILLAHPEQGIVVGRLNLAFSRPDAGEFWNRMVDALTDLSCPSAKPETGNDAFLPAFPEPAFAKTPSAESSLPEFHVRLIEEKLKVAADFGTGDEGPGLQFFEQSLQELGLSDCRVLRVTRRNWPEWRQAVEAIQEEIYEPARRTDIEKFDELVAESRSISFLVCRGDAIVAMAFSGPLRLFGEERGVSADPEFHDPDVLYMLDLTVRPSHRGALGRIMKQATALTAADCGYTAIHGRNRDRLAGSMWAINLGLGSFQTRHFANDYPDQELFRDCIYYRCPLKWNEPPNLCGAFRTPLGLQQLSPPFVREQLIERTVHMPVGFESQASSRRRLEIQSWFRTRGPSSWVCCHSLRQAVNTVARSLASPFAASASLAAWHGSWLDGFDGVAAGFSEPTGRVGLFGVSGESPSWSSQLEEATARLGRVAGIILEPLGQRNLRRVGIQELHAVVGLGRKMNVPVVFLETASQGYRFDLEHYSASQIEGLTPDIVITSLGPQLTVIQGLGNPSSGEVGMTTEFAPDVASLATYHEAMRLVREDLPRFRKDVARFEQRFIRELEERQCQSWDIRCGAGSFKMPDANLGPADRSWLEQFEPSAEPGTWLVCPSWSQMQEYFRH